MSDMDIAMCVDLNGTKECVKYVKCSPDEILNKARFLIRCTAAALAKQRISHSSTLECEFDV
jgi:hypothetical protein